MLDTIKKSILELGCFSTDELTLFSTKLKMTKLPRQAFLLKEGQVCRSFYFIQAGSVRQYYVTDDTNEVILNLFIEGDWVTDYQSFTTQQSSKNNLQTFEKSEIYELTVYDFHELIHASSSFFQLGKLLGKPLRDTFIGQASYLERYEMLLTQKPKLIQRFPLKYIASYLGVTPETLSRIRRKIAQ